MKIFRPEVTEKGEDVYISARVETTSCPVDLPDTLWFSFPRKFCDHVSGDLNGFAVALLPLAMTLGEDLHMEGVLSPRLLSGMEEYQRIQCAWKPSPFLPVSLKPDTLQPMTAVSAGAGVGCSFSGGVDSAYTLWRHLPENEPIRNYRISHCLMINGFDADTDLDSSGKFSRVEQVMQPMMSRLGTELVVCKTNYMAFSDPNILKQSFAAMVTSPALVLGGLFSSFYIPSSLRFDDFLREGSHPMLDHLIATETMETIHDSSHLKRTDKVRAISHWSETYSTLRVCFGETGYDEETNAIQNCCRCEKCIRTMKALELCGGLKNYKTFPRRLSHFNVWICNLGFKWSQVFAKEIILEAFKARRFSIAMDYCIAIVITKLFKFPRMFLLQILLFIEKRSGSNTKQVRRITPGRGNKPRMIK